MTRRGILVTALLISCLLLGTTSCVSLEELDSSLDSDGDGWSDVQEEIAGTDPDDVDTDNDGYWDPLDPNPLNPDIPGSDWPAEPATSPTTTPAPTPDVSASSDNVTPTVAPGQMALREFREVQAAVEFMMRNNKLASLTHPVTAPANDMRRFPDISTRHGAAGMGYVLCCHDSNGDGKPDINYIRFSKTKGTYTCDEYGNVTQVTTGYE